jgi:hypothetical protein
MPRRNDVENILPHVHGWKSQKDEKMNESWTTTNLLDDKYNGKIFLDENSCWLKFMDEIHSKTIMSDGNHMNMYENYKMN